MLLQSQVSAQLFAWSNPSFDGPAPGSSISPPNWTGVQGSPDTQPGCWSVAVAPAHGTAYIGLVYLLSLPTSQESAAQLLPTAMTAGTQYNMSVKLINLDVYNGSWNGGAVVSFYGGTGTTTANAFSQLLWTSGNFVNSSWVTFNGTFTPTSSWTHFALRIEPGVGTTWPGAGVDNMTVSIALPVKISHFGATVDGDVAQIDWETTEEDNLANYTLQRAGTDMDFKDLVTIDATGVNGEAQSYHHTDENLPEGLSYYRLRLNDQNGASTLSEVRQVLFSKTGENIAIKHLFPNPADAFSRLDLVSLVDQTVDLKVFEITGKLVYSAAQEIQAGDTRIDLPANEWRSGVYRLQVRSGSTVLTRSLVVAR